MVLMYGEHDPREFDLLYEQHGIIINLSTMREGFMKLHSLIPPRYIGKTYSREFDINYADYILSNDMAFGEFFMIVYQLNSNKDVYIMSSMEDWADNVTQSLLKLYQQRYGINAVEVKTEEDYIDAKMRENTSITSGDYLFNLDMDNKRFSEYVMFLSIKYGRVPWDLEGFKVESF